MEAPRLRGAQLALADADLADTVRDCEHVRGWELRGEVPPEVGECPYAAELHGGQRCRCCDGCRYSCAQDI